MDTNTNYIPIFKALADETRLKIIEMLSCGEMCACDFLESFQISQPTLSYHLKILSDCGLVQSRKEGSWIIFRNNNDMISSIQNYLKFISTEHDTCICKKIKTNENCKN